MLVVGHHRGILGLVVVRSADLHVTRTRYSIQVQYPHAVAANNMSEEDRDAHEHAQSAAEQTGTAGARNDETLVPGNSW